MIARSGLIEHYRNEREAADRIENLGELVTAAAAFDVDEHASGLETGEGDAETPAIDPLTAFLTHAALEAGEHQAGEGQDALQLMTVHSAKGLEFDRITSYNVCYTKLLRVLPFARLVLAGFEGRVREERRQRRNNFV